MPNPSPWDDIAIPTIDFNVRRVGGAIAAPCFWGKDMNGACLFIVELEGDHATQYRKNITTVSGINVDLRSTKTGRQHLLLTLESDVNRDLFQGLCKSLAEALTHATDSPSSLSVTQAHIRRWKTFFSGKGAPRLSTDEVRGLFAELIFLLELLDRGHSTSAAIDAWLGPEMSHQDFIFGNTAVEIKSISGVERSTVRISSEDQLESLNDALFLRIYRLSKLPVALESSSLNEIVEGLQSRLADTDALEGFERKLMKQGYAPLPEYDEPRLVVTEVRTYRVAEHFPTLIRSRLPVGIAKVAYDIKLEAIAAFECANHTIFEDI